jgi:hypothetical protein
MNVQSNSKGTPPGQSSAAFGLCIHFSAYCTSYTLHTNGPGKQDITYLHFHLTAE